MEVIDDLAIDEKQGPKIKKLLYCSGKIYYDLLERKLEAKRDDVAIVRVEQLYPFPQTQLDQIAKKYPNADPFWVQEESLNMGSWQYILSFEYIPNLKLISRPASASPATGFKKVHDESQKEIVDKAFA